MISERRLVRTEDFPNDQEERMAAILGGVVNTEPKSITTALLRRTAQSCYELGRSFTDVTNGIWRIDNKSFTNYCRQSLIPIGMVTEEELLYLGYANWRSAFSLSEAGEHYGQPIAAFTLQKVNEYADSIFSNVQRDDINGRSMFEILGSTTSKGKTRAPYNRKRLLSYLRNVKIAREKDIFDVLDILDASEGLEELKKIGLVNYESVPEEIGWSKYAWIEGKDPENVKTVRKRRYATRTIANILKDLDNANRYKIYELLKMKGIEINLRTISTVLSGLEKQGFAKSHFRVSERQSEASITDLGRFLLEDYFDRVEVALQDSNELDIMRTIAERYKQHPDELRCIASKAVLIYKSVSPSYHKRPLEETMQKIYDFIEAKEKVRPKDIEKELGIRNPYDYIRPLMKTGNIKREIIGKAVFYKVAD